MGHDVCFVCYSPLTCSVGTTGVGARHHDPHHLIITTTAAVIIVNVNISAAGGVDSLPIAGPGRPPLCVSRSVMRGWWRRSSAHRTYPCATTPTPWSSSSEKRWAGDRDTTVKEGLHIIIMIPSPQPDEVLRIHARRRRGGRLEYAVYRRLWTTGPSFIHRHYRFTILIQPCLEHASSDRQRC